MIKTVTYGGRTTPVRHFPLTRDQKRALVKEVKRGRKREDIELAINTRDAARTRETLKCVAFGEAYGMGPARIAELWRRPAPTRVRSYMGGR